MYLIKFLTESFFITKTPTNPYYNDKISQDRRVYIKQLLINPQSAHTIKPLMHLPQKYQIALQES